MKNRYKKKIKYYILGLENEIKAIYSEIKAFV